MDLSDPPEADRDLIEAAKLKAQSILEDYQEQGNELAAEAYHLGVDPSGIGFSPGSVGLESAREKFAEGRSESFCLTPLPPDIGRS